jgi:hypothetical protein
MDPRLEQPPDFANHNLYRLIIQDKVAGGSSQEDAVAYVRTVWERNRDQRAAAWDAQQAQQAQQPPAAPNVQAAAQGEQGHQGIPANPAPQAQAVAPPAGDLPGNGAVLPQQPPAVEEIRARDPPKSLPIVIITGQPVSENLSYQPERKVLEALRKRQYVPLYYFLDSTCKAAFERRSFLAADELTLQLDGNTVTLAEPRSKFIRDDELPYVDFHSAQTCLLASMSAEGYNQALVAGLAKMFGQLDRHAIRRETHGDKVVQRYAARTRVTWHNAMPVRPLFDISVINETLLRNIQSQLVMDFISLEYEAR